MTIKPQNLEEKLVWYTIIGTYGLYFLGAQYVWIPTLGFSLTLYLFKKLWNQTKNTPNQDKITIPTSVWVWVVSMLVMEIALIMAHIDFDLGVPKIIFTTVNSWARSWALMALFPLIGCLRIRPQLLYRAACILSLQSLVLTVICYLFYLLQIPDFVYVSPLKVFRGSTSHYVIDLFVIGESNQFRLQLFTNFANTLGIVGNIYFFLTSQESNKKWRLIGMIGAAAMVLGSGSRLTIFCLVVVPILSWFLTNFTWHVQIAIGVSSFLTSLFAPLLVDFLETTYNKTIKGYRAGSERVRSQLKKIALERWSEAPIWGHGFVAERGPKTTEFMPIGSHEQWTDLLYVRGAVGFTAFLIAMLWSLANLLIKAQKSPTAKVGLSIYLVFLIATFGADIEEAAYVYWPGLMLTGIAFKEKAPSILDKNSYVLP